MTDTAYLAIDMGASSGRHVAGLFDGRTLRLQEVFRFENGAVPASGHLYWNYLGLWTQIRNGLRAAAQQFGQGIASIGIDTWGVDYALLDRHDEVLGNPITYRDRRTDGMLERAFQIVPRSEIFRQTGLQFLTINTLYQLLAQRLSNSVTLEQARSLLMMPDLFHWLLTGVKANEFTEASTTQLLNPRTQRWSTELIGKFGLPRGIFADVVPPGTKLGPLLPEVATDVGLSNVEVVLPGTHDTACAVLAVPAASQRQAKPDWCYISSGTWSLMGVESPSPVIDDKCLALNFTNEGGVANTIHLLKNIVGLWLVQECRRVWNQAGRPYSWDDLNRLSAAALPLAHLINPDDPLFLSPSHMPDAIRSFCARTGQSVPNDEGAVIRCALESLALQYRRVLGWLEALIGGRIETIHIVGGGTQNRQLCQATADACQRQVVAGPIEATAIGNVMMQAVAAGEVSSIAEAREIIRNSFTVETYLPREGAAWDEAYARFAKL